MNKRLFFLVAGVLVLAFVSFLVERESLIIANTPQVRVTLSPDVKPEIICVPARFGFVECYEGFNRVGLYRLR